MKKALTKSTILAFKAGTYALYNDTDTRIKIENIYLDPEYYIYSQGIGQFSVTTRSMRGALQHIPTNNISECLSKKPKQEALMALKTLMVYADPNCSNFDVKASEEVLLRFINDI